MIAELIDPAILGFILVGVMLFAIFVGFPISFTLIFLTRDGKIVSQFDTTIDVKKVGLERFLFNLSRQNPLIYGLMSLAIAIFAGWVASSFFRYIRHT